MIAPWRDGPRLRGPGAKGSSGPDGEGASVETFSVKTDGRKGSTLRIRFVGCARERSSPRLLRRGGGRPPRWQSAPRLAGREGTVGGYRFPRELAYLLARSTFHISFWFGFQGGHSTDTVREETSRRLGPHAEKQPPSILSAMASARSPACGRENQARRLGGVPCPDAGFQEGRFAPLRL